MHAEACQLGGEGSALSSVILRVSTSHCSISQWNNGFVVRQQMMYGESNTSIRCCRRPHPLQHECCIHTAGASFTLEFMAQRAMEHTANAI